MSGAIVIVNWKTPDLVISCLRSLCQEIRVLAEWHVYVVDNDSQDGSAEKIERARQREGWADWVTVIQAARNGGFSYGANIGITRGLRDNPGLHFLFLLNPDTEIRRGAITVLRDFLQNRPSVGLAGARSEDPDGTAQECAFAFPSLLREFASGLRLGVFDRLFSRQLRSHGTPDKPTEVDWVSGAALMIRREVFEQIGLLDEGYFLYFEETDFAVRAKRAGWRCWHVPESRVVHLVGQSSGLSSRDSAPPRRPAYWFESRRRFFVLNYGLAYCLVVDTLFLIGYVTWRARRLIQRKPYQDPPHFLRDFLAGSALCRGRTELAPRKSFRVDLKCHRFDA